MANNVVLIFIAVYLLGVVFKGNTDKLLAELKKDSKFLPWLIAVLILYQLKQSAKLGAVGDGLITLTFVGMFLQNNNGVNFFNQLTKFFKGN